MKRAVATAGEEVADAERDVATEGVSECRGDDGRCRRRDSERPKGAGWGGLSRWDRGVMLSSASSEMLWNAPS